MNPVGILVVSTGSFSKSMVDWAVECFGAVEYLRALDLSANPSWDAARERLKNEIIVLDKGSGVLIFTDVEGGTPFNLTKSLLDLGSSGLGPQRLQLISGVNVPMLFKALQIAKQSSVEEISEQIVSYGKSHISLFKP